MSPLEQPLNTTTKRELSRFFLFFFGGGLENSEVGLPLNTTKYIIGIRIYLWFTWSSWPHCRLTTYMFFPFYFIFFILYFFIFFISVFFCLAHSEVGPPLHIPIVDMESLFERLGSSLFFFILSDLVFFNDFVVVAWQKFSKVSALVYFPTSLAYFVKSFIFF